MRKFLTATGLAIGIAATGLIAADVSAQQGTQAPQQQQTGAPQDGEQRMGRRGGRQGRRHHGRGMKDGAMRGRALERLNLTDAQREQFRALHRGNAEKFSTQRQELREIFKVKRDGGTLTPEQEARTQALRQELRASRKQAREQSLTILTPEQRTQLEGFKQERKARREQRRQQRMNNNQNNLQ